MFERREGDSGTELSHDAFEPLSFAQPTDSVAVADDRAIGFRGFTVFPGSRTMLRDGKPVCIGGRAFDLLIILLRSRGCVVTQEEIRRFVWPAMFVEESNLRFQVGCLRKALGADADLIKTVPGRGYLFAADQNAVCSTAHGRSQRDAGLVDYTPVPAASRWMENPVSAGEPGANAELLDGFLRSAGVLVATYGSLEAFLGALALHRGGHA